MTTRPDFDEFLTTFRSRALARMESYEKAVEKAHAAAVKSMERPASTRATPPPARQMPIAQAPTQGGSLVRRSW